MEPASFVWQKGRSKQDELRCVFVCVGDTLSFGGSQQLLEGIALPPKPGTRIESQGGDRAVIHPW